MEGLERPERDSSRVSLSRSTSSEVDESHKHSRPCCRSCLSF